MPRQITSCISIREIWYWNVSPGSSYCIIFEIIPLKITIQEQLYIEIDPNLSR